METPVNTFNAAKAIQLEIRSLVGAPEEGFTSVSQSVIPFTLIRGTRGYLEKVVNQINGCYENG